MSNMKTTKRITVCFFLIALLVYVSCKKEKGEDIVISTVNTPTVLTPYQIPTPPYFPQLIIPTDNPLTLEGIELGRRLYYDTILSNTGQSCSSCHSQSLGFSNETVNSLPHINLGWNSSFLWNGEIQGGLENAMMFEVNVFFNTNVAKLNNDPYYPALFRKVYNVDIISSKEIAYSLAQFIRRLYSINSKFDKYLRHETMLTLPEINGFVIYNTEKGDCFHCHSLGLFTDNSFHNIGLDSIYTGINQGQFNITNNPNDRGKFKSPTLRNIELTAPYMHDGRYTTLEEVIEHYNSMVKPSATLDPILTKSNHTFGLQLTTQEINDLVAFLKTLTDTTFISDNAISSPF